MAHLCQPLLYGSRESKLNKVTELQTDRNTDYQSAKQWHGGELCENVEGINMLANRPNSQTMIVKL